MINERIREWDWTDWSFAILSFVVVLSLVIGLEHLFKLTLGWGWSYLLRTAMPLILAFGITEWLKGRREEKKR